VIVVLCRWALRSSGARTMTSAHFTRYKSVLLFTRALGSGDGLRRDDVDRRSVGNLDAARSANRANLRGD
jgi:hypothetical protein